MAPFGGCDRLFRHHGVARGHPDPQACIEFEVAHVARAATELAAKGYQLIHEARTEPWTQITARLLSPEGLLVAVCYIPAFHDPHDTLS